MKTAYLVRYGAYGDHVHMSNVIKALDELDYHITFEYNFKGLQIQNDNPRVNVHIPFEPPHRDAQKDDYLRHYKRHMRLMDKYDLYVNFSHSLEDALIAGASSSEYYWPLDLRRAKNANTCYYDQSMKWAGLTDEKYMGRTGEIFYRKEDHEYVVNLLNKYKDRFILIYAFRGTMQQKATYPLAEPVINAFLDRHPDVLCITTGDPECQKWEFDHPNVWHVSGRMPFRQVLLMTRYADLVVTPETGLGIGAGSYGTPKIMMLTAASKKNIVGNDKNDYSLQSEAWCSPCTRAIYDTDHCPMKNGHPICVDFDPEQVVERMEEVYQAGIPSKSWEIQDEPVYV